MRSRLTLAGAAFLAFSFTAATAAFCEPLLTFRTAGPEAAGMAERDGLGLDMAGFDALPQTTFQTRTPWDEGVVTFSGVRLADYLAAMKAKPERIRLVALNDYSVDAEVSELLDGDALLATRRNGAPMPVSDKGPVFLVFPFDSRSELQHQTYYSRSVWQLAEIDVVR